MNLLFYFIVYVIFCLTGTQCETYNTCKENRCQQNSTCVIAGAVYACECIPGTHGQFCQFEDVCAIEEPCGEHGECEPVSSLSFSVLQEFQTGSMTL